MDFVTPSVPTFIDEIGLVIWSVLLLRQRMRQQLGAIGTRTDYNVICVIHSFVLDATVPQLLLYHADCLNIVVIITCQVLVIAQPPTICAKLSVTFNPLEGPCLLPHPSNSNSTQKISSVIMTKAEDSNDEPHPKVQSPTSRDLRARDCAISVRAHATSHETETLTRVRVPPFFRHPNSTRVPHSRNASERVSVSMAYC